MNTISVVSVDDHHLIHEAIRSLLADEECIDLVAEGYAGDDVLTLVGQHRPDVLLLDLVMPKRRGWDPNRGIFLPIPTFAKLRQKFPDTGVIILSQYLDYDIAQAATQNGVRGYLLKSDDLTLHLPEAIKQVHQGRVFFSSEVSSELFRRLDHGADEAITWRQRQIILAVAKSPDTPYVELAERLGISYRTFKGHLDSAYKVLAVSNVTACIIRSMQLGLIPFSQNGKGICFGDL